MGSYTERDLADGKGLAPDRSMIAYSYDLGRTWDTCELVDAPKHARHAITYRVPPPAQGGWAKRI